MEVRVVLTGCLASIENIFFSEEAEHISNVHINFKKQLFNIII